MYICVEHGIIVFIKQWNMKMTSERIAELEHLIANIIDDMTGYDHSRDRVESIAHIILVSLMGECKNEI
jgi:DNA-binding transcriptional regulator YhcF (GntR family)